MSEGKCTMAAMVEASRDGRLDAREQDSLARHLAACASCRALAVDLARLAGLAARPLLPEQTPLEHQRGRLALLNQAAVGDSPDQARRRRLWVALAASSLVATVGLLAHEATRDRSVAMARTLPALRPLRAVRVETTVRGAASARFTRVQMGTVERVELDDGAIDLEVRPLRQGERFLVATGDAEVEVRGTVFHVEAHQRHIAAVAVAEGKVEVRYAGSLTLLGPGAEWSPPGDVAAEPSPRALDNDGDSARPAEPGSAPHSASTQGSTMGLRAAEPGSGAAPSDRKIKADASAPGASSQAFAEGMRLIERGDYAAGADKLDAYQHQNPSDARAEDAAYLTIIAFQRAGRRDAALAAARRYLQQYPRGYRHAEVQALVR
jgi:hypothetical protein